MRQGWFGPNRIGWGVSPRSWQGWVVSAVLIALVAASMRWLRPAIQEGMGWPLVTISFAIIGIWVALFVAVVWLTYEHGERRN